MIQLETVADTLIPFIDTSNNEAYTALRKLDKHVDALEHALAQQGAAYERVCAQADKYERELLTLKSALFDAGLCRPQPLDDMDF